jgi:alkylation response protein AidB-like acyl-CoA dehydrogenase
MDLSFTPEQQDIRAGVRRLLSAEASDAMLIAQQDKPTGYVPAIWDALAQGGWHGVLIPEEYGGIGSTLSNACVVFEEYGAGPLPHLYFTAAAVSPLLILEAGDAAQRARLLPQLADGSMRVTAAIAEVETTWTGARFQTLLANDDGALRLSGEKMYVPDAAGATHALVAARTNGHTALVLVDLAAAGCSSERLEGFTSWESRIVFENVAVEPQDVLGWLQADAGHAVQRALKRTIAPLCAYQVGSCQAVFEMALSHSRTRIQFGQPVGRFQRVQDHVIELTNHLDAARWTTYETIWKLEGRRPEAEAALHMIKALVAEAHWEACNYAHEVHAGLGADMQYGLAKHTYLSHSLYHFLGSPAWHRDQLVMALKW